MIKTIKLGEPVYNRLDAVRGKRETFSQAVERLLFIRDQIAAISDNVAPLLYPADLPKPRNPVGAAPSG